MTLKTQIEGAGGDPAALETVYRQALDAGEEAAFKEAIAQSIREDPEDILFSTWAYRLNIRPLPVEGADRDPGGRRLWGTAVVASAILGTLYALFAGDKPPVPIPGEATPLFWIGWSPLTALCILFYLAAIDRTRKQQYGRWAITVVPLALIVALMAWDRSDHLAALFALHLPFAVWAAVGAGVALGRPDPAQQCYAFLVKSVETLLTGGVYFGTGGLFLALTYGIFAVLGVELPETGMRIVAAWGIGAIPLLALTSVYDPSVPPVSQNGATGFARILRILTRLMLPLALIVLFVYVCWFIPAYFWRPFEERQVLIVYNATIMAVLVLLAIAAVGPNNNRSPRQDAILRRALLATGSLTLLLNAYALAAIASRTFTLGLTPNRYAVFGWNMVTLSMLAVVLIGLWKAEPERWIRTFRASIARVVALAVVWALWVLLVLPLSF